MGTWALNSTRKFPLTIHRQMKENKVKIFLDYSEDFSLWDLIPS